MLQPEAQGWFSTVVMLSASQSGAADYKQPMHSRFSIL
jgi:hypothetical protein